jgi:hypothetical protein
MDRETVKCSAQFNSQAEFSRPSWIMGVGTRTEATGILGEMGHILDSSREIGAP